MKTKKILMGVAFALFFTVIGFGFAALTSQLTISGTATYTPSQNNFIMAFSSSDSSLQTGSIMAQSSDDSINASSATIDNSSFMNPIITGIDITFSDAGQYATYNFYIYNAGSYTGYLQSINFGYISAVPAYESTATQEEANAMLNGLLVTVTVGANNYTSSTQQYNNISGVSIAAGSSLSISVRIEIVSGTPIASDTVNFTIGNITLEFSNVDANSLS